MLTHSRLNTFQNVEATNLTERALELHSTRYSEGQTILKSESKDRREREKRIEKKERVSMSGESMPKVNPP
jgi:hypothetical protein